MSLKLPAGALPGSTSGSAIGAGYIGEKITFTARTISTAGVGASAWTGAGAAALATLTAGVWLIVLNVEHSSTTTVTHWRMGIATNNSADSSGFLASAPTAGCNVKTAGATQSHIQTAIGAVVLSGSTTIYAKLFTETATGSADGGGFAVRIA